MSGRRDRVERRDLNVLTDPLIPEFCYYPHPPPQYVLFPLPFPCRSFIESTFKVSCKVFPESF